jgi:multidrug resistance protein
MSNTPKNDYAKQHPDSQPIAESNGSLPDEPLSRVSTGPPYTIFTSKEKALIVALGAIGALLSPLTANIYYPALVDLARDLGVSYNDINLSITVYLIFQGIAPTFTASIADAKGRRPAYILCLTFYLAANIGLSLQNSYAGLMVLRCLQSSGSSGMVTFGNAMVSDIATSSQRGSYIGWASIGVLLGPAIGPIIGGLLNQSLGWRAIFWFLVVVSGVIFLIFLVILPETCRAVVGNGSIPAQRWNISLLTYLKQHQLRKSGAPPSDLSSRPPPKNLNLLGTLRIIFSKEAPFILIYSGFLFGGFYAVAATIPVNFSTIYRFNYLQVGLCYLPFGFGSMTAAVISGRTLDWNFRRHAKRLNITISRGRQTDLRGFPIEMARVQVIAPFIISGSLFIIAFGWVLHASVSLAGPLILLYFVGFSATGAFTTLNTLIIDLYLESPSTATAASNWVRCWIGAGAVAIVGPLLSAVGMGWVGVIVAFIWVCASPLLWVVYKWGPGWREEKRVREEKKEDEQSEKKRHEDIEGGNGVMSEIEENGTG